MRVTGKWVLLSVLGCWGCVFVTTREQSHLSQPTSSVTGSIAVVPEDLLQRSYSTGNNFAPEERCYQLVMLTKAAEQLPSARAKSSVRSWSNELFRRASELPPSWNRSAFQKNALETLASVDPANALSMLPKVDWPVSNESLPTEDLRAFAAITVYRRLWERQGIGALPVIWAQAREIGRTGEYPYVAMLQVSQKLQELKDSSTPPLLFREALDFYEKGPKVQVADRDFVTYLEAEWLFLPSNLRMEALTAVVGHLTRDQKSNPAISETVRVVTDKGTAQFSSRRSALLYHVLPKVRQLNPDWATQLEEDHPELRQAAGGAVQFTTAATIVNSEDASAERVATVRDKLHQGQLLGQLQKQATDEPDKAADLLPYITDSELQVEALASLASAFRDTQPRHSAELFGAARNRTEALPANPVKLSALAALAAAAASMRNDAEMELAIGQAFDLGEELLREDLDIHPGQAVYESAIREELSNIAKVAGQFALSSTMTRIDHVRDDVLQAYLLIATAEGLKKRQQELSARKSEIP